MKITSRFYIGSETVTPVDIRLALELSAAGLGFVTVPSKENLQGKMVALDLGYSGKMLRWFTGIVERSQQAERGWQRILIRELTGILARPMPCSIQHPTLRDVCNWVTEQCGLAFALPEGQKYTDTPIPNFTHSGSGYQLLNNLGRAFAIPDYIWQQLPEGAVFVGSWQQSRWPSLPVEIPQGFSDQQHSGNTMRIVCVPAMRPGAVINGKRIKRVDLTDDQMSITWAVTDSKGREAQKSQFRRQAEKEFPELAAGLHLPKIGRVESISDTTGNSDLSDPFRPRFAVNVQLLDENGKPDKSVPLYNAVPLPTGFGGSDSGLMQYPAPGTLVELAFSEARPDRPHIRQIMAQGLTLPAVAADEQVQQARCGVLQKTNSRGDVSRETDQAQTESARVRKIKADEEKSDITERRASIAGDDVMQIGGSHRLYTLGSIQQMIAGDIDTGAGGDHRHAVGQELVEVIGKMRRSVAKELQHFEAGKSWTGTDAVNIFVLLDELMQCVQRLATADAAHIHMCNCGPSKPPVTAPAFTAEAAAAGALHAQLSPIIEK
ncbi:hypothetical protein ACXZ3X_001143 [Escherichia coli]